MSTLTTYLNETRRLLADAAGNYWSDADLIACINDAMRQRDLDTGQNRAMQSVPLVAGQNFYTINTGSFNPRTIGVFGVVVILANARKRLAERSYPEASTIWQPTTTYSSWPEVFAHMSPTLVYIAPKSNQVYQAEWDTMLVSPDLVNGSDTDPLPYPWTDCVPYGAAHKANLQLQRYDEAQQFKQLYQQSRDDAVGGVRGLYVPYPYPLSRSRL